MMVSMMQETSSVNEWYVENGQFIHSFIVIVFFLLPLQNYVLVSNCHSHVSTALNHMQYNGRNDYNEHKLFWLFNKNCHYVR